MISVKGTQARDVGLVWPYRRQTHHPTFSSYPSKCASRWQRQCPAASGEPSQQGWYRPRACKADLWSL